MQSTKNKTIIVGGGIAGLMAGLWSQTCGYQTTIIERAKACGGLLQSSKSESGYYFDYGTHIPALTGHDIVDELMFGSDIALEWIEIPKLKKGNFFEGQLNTDSQFIDVRNLPKTLNEQVLSELVHSMTTDKDAKNLEEALELHYGKALTHQVFEPLLKRIYQTPLGQLDRNAHRFLAYGRVIVASSEVSKELKKSLVYDAKIAHTYSHDGGVGGQHLYPMKHGTGAWVEAILNRFEQLGGVVMTDKAINEINDDQSTITLADNTVLNYQKLIWTAPIALLAKLLFPEMCVSKPRFVPTGLHHFVFDKMPLCDSHYIYVNDPDANAFRVTLYSNIDASSGNCRVSVEAIADASTGVADNQVIYKELIKAKIISSDTNIVESHATFLPFGFPEMTLDLNAENELMRQAIAKIDNIMIGGRGAGEAFFMNDVLKGLAESLEDGFGKPAFL